jgi:hypothetical protein
MRAQNSTRRSEPWQPHEKLAIAVLALTLWCLALTAILIVKASADIWQDCPTLMEFCKHRVFHRDCVTYGLKQPVRCVCVELRDFNGDWPRRDCGWTDDKNAPALSIIREPPPPIVPCLQPGHQACN